MLFCPQGSVIDSVKFASFGAPSGACGKYKQGDCHDDMAKGLVEDLCKGDGSCVISASSSLFQDVCPQEEKNLRVQVSCSGSPIFEEAFLN